MRPFDWPIIAPKKRRGFRAKLYRIRSALWATVLGLCACTDILDVQDQRAATPNEVQRNVAWAIDVRSCAGLSGDPYRIRWFYASRIWLDGRDTVLGAQRGNDIFVVPSSPPPGEPMKGAVHRHEVLHWLLWTASGDGDGSHSDDRWPVCPRVEVQDDPQTQA